MYIPKIEDSEVERKQKPLLEPGLYNFEVTQAEDTTSKSGNSMIKLTLKVWDKSGNDHYIWDYLVDLESMWFRSKNFLESVNATYENVHLAAVDCLQKSGKLVLEIRKDANGHYPDQNGVKSYYVEPKNDLFSESKDDFDDEIPF